MDWVWTWSGQCFGYWIEADLWTHYGKHVGRRMGAEIYGPTGRYIGELTNDGRLITTKSKAGLDGPIFVPSETRPPETRPLDSKRHPLYWGHTDFPPPGEF